MSGMKLRGQKTVLRNRFIHWSLSLFGHTGVLLWSETVEVVLIVLSVGSCNDNWQKERASSFDGSIYNSFLVLKWFHSFPKGTIGYAIIIKKIFKSGHFDLPRISDIALKITESAVSIVTSTKFDLSIEVWNNNWYCSYCLWNLRKLIERKLPEYTRFFL